MTLKKADLKDISKELRGQPAPEWVNRVEVHVTKLPSVDVADTDENGKDDSLLARFGILKRRKS